MSTVNATNTSPIRTRPDTPTVPAKDISSSVDDISTVANTVINQPEATPSATVPGSFIAPTGAAHVNSDKPTESVISPAQQALVRSCLDIIEEHRKGNITHMQAMIQICGILPDDKFGTNAFATYVEQLSQTDRDWLIASVRGTNLPAVPSDGRMPPNTAATTDKPASRVPDTQRYALIS